MTSLRKSLTLSLTAILVVVFLCLWASISFAISKVAQDQLLMHLEHDGDALMSGLTINGGGRLHLLEASVEQVYRQANSGHYYAIRSAGDAIESPSLAGASLATPPLPPGQRSSLKIPGPGGQTVLVLARGVTLHGEDLLVVVGEDLQQLHREVEEQSIFILLIIIPILVAAVLMQRFIIGRELSPLLRAEEALQRLGRGEIERIDVVLPGEVQPLVDEVNRLLQLVNRRLAQSRTAIGNLAHALKTPLAMLFRVADDAGVPGETRQILREQTDVIHGRLERELKRARLAGGQHGGSSIQLRRELEDLAKVLQAIYREKDPQIEIVAPAGPLPYDREDLLELLGNLADNACKWARRIVRIDIAEAAPGLRIRVADDGPGCSPADCERLMQRGLRLDESKPGHGLGLAICREIVDFYGGDMQFAPDPELGGLAVSIQLPQR